MLTQLSAENISDIFPIASVDDANSSERSKILDIPVIEYMKGEKSTREMGISTKGAEFLGRGGFGTVTCIHSRSDMVLKKGVCLVHEWEVANHIGRHPNLVHVEALYRKSYPGNLKEAKHKLCMKKIEGKTLEIQSKDGVVINLSQFSCLVEQIRSLCMTLFAQKVAWGDVQEGNVMLNLKENKLVFFDLGFWVVQFQMGESQVCDLYKGAHEVIISLLKITSLSTLKFRRLRVFLQKNPRLVNGKDLDLFFSKIQSILKSSSFYDVINTLRVSIPRA